MASGRFYFYYGWVNVILAAVAMTATLPGRTHGLGLITKPLMEDLNLTESYFAQINLGSTLLGALFCVPVGYLIDRLGVRWMVTVVVSLLTLSVYGLTQVASPLGLLVVLTFIRGFGQSALSIVSMAMVGKWFRGRLGIAMGVYAVLLTIGFIASILGMGWALEQWNWRGAWTSLAISLAVSIPFFALLTRSTPEESGVSLDAEKEDVNSKELEGQVYEFSVMEVMQMPSFWIFVSGTSAFNFVWSSITLFNESILNELQFDRAQAVEMMAWITGVGLLTNMAIGKFATRKRLAGLLAVGLIVLAIAMMLFPSIRGISQLRVYGCALGFVGGLITVVHFTVWASWFGRAELGRIQGVSQIATVVASAMGPLFIAWFHESTGSFMGAYYWIGGALFVLSVLAMCIQSPAPKTRLLARS